MKEPTAQSRKITTFDGSVRVGGLLRVMRWTLILPLSSPPCWRSTSIL